MLLPARPEVPRPRIGWRGLGRVSQRHEAGTSQPQRSMNQSSTAPAHPKTPTLAISSPTPPQRCFTAIDRIPPVSCILYPQKVNIPHEPNSGLSPLPSPSYSVQPPACLGGTQRGRVLFRVLHTSYLITHGRLPPETERRRGGRSSLIADSGEGGKDACRT